MARVFTCDVCGIPDRSYEAQKAHLRLSSCAPDFSMPTGSQIELELCAMCAIGMVESIEATRERLNPGWREREAEAGRRLVPTNNLFEQEACFSCGHTRSSCLKAGGCCHECTHFGGRT